MPEDFKAGFLKTLWIIRDYLSEIVIGGGWVPLIYYHYLLADKSREPIHTRDIDLMVKLKLPVIGSKTVDQLLVEAGFEPNFKSRETPPVICYEGNIDGYEIEIEFLTDQRGAKEDVVIEVQKGLSAQSLNEPKLTFVQGRNSLISHLFSCITDQEVMRWHPGGQYDKREAGRED